MFTFSRLSSFRLITAELRFASALVFKVSER